MRPDLEYRLDLIDSSQADLPTVMLVFLSNTGHLDLIQYVDLNEDVNKLVFMNHALYGECPEGKFEPNYADSVEVIRLDL